MEEKTSFVYRALADNEIFSELCAEFGISTKRKAESGKRKMEFVATRTWLAEIVGVFIRPS